MLRSSVLALASLALFTAGAASAMEPIVLQSSAPADHGYSQEQAAINARGRDLKAEATADPNHAQLQQGPAHPGATPLLNLGF